MPKVTQVELNIKLIANVVEDEQYTANTLAMGACLKGLNRFRKTVLDGDFEGFDVQQTHFATSDSPDAADQGELLYVAVVETKSTTERDIDLTREECDSAVRGCVRGTHAEEHVEKVIREREPDLQLAVNNTVQH